MLNSRNQSKPSSGKAKGTISKLRRMLARPPKPKAKARKLSEREIDALSRRVILPTLPVSDEEMARATHQDRGQKLARQDRWEDLSARIRYTDETRLSTPAGETASLLLAYGARSDVVSATEDALHDGAEPDPVGMEDLEEVLMEQEDDYACALVVALAHLDIAWAWHCIRFDKDPAESLTKAKFHVSRAEDILDRYNGEELNAPSVLAAQSH